MDVTGPGPRTAHGGSAIHRQAGLGVWRCAIQLRDTQSHRVAHRTAPKRARRYRPRHATCQEGPKATATRSRQAFCLVPGRDRPKEDRGDEGFVEARAVDAAVRLRAAAVRDVSNDLQLGHHAAWFGLRPAAALTAASWPPLPLPGWAGHRWRRAPMPAAPPSGPPPVTEAAPPPPTPPSTCPAPAASPRLSVSTALQAPPPPSPGARGPLQTGQARRLMKRPCA